jgi:outer membrane immunogenic protein
VIGKLLFGAAFVTLTAAAPAFAADLTVKAPTQIPAVSQFSWTGCYVGAHLGGVVSADGNSINFGSSGFVGGGQIGCDYQFAPQWVAGVEGRAAWSSLETTHSATVRSLATGAIIPSQFTLGNDFLASTTARLGYVFAERWLVFARGGAAWTNEKVDDAFINLTGIPVDPSASRMRTGWTVGTGVDWAFAPHWSATLEYNYYDFGEDGVVLTSAPPLTRVTISSLKDTIHAVTAGVNYHF